MPDHGEVILRFDEVSFEFGHDKPILTEASFSVREHAKLTIMGQNGAGKSTIFKMIMGEYKPKDGHIHLRKSTSIAMGMQVIPRHQYEFSVLHFFESAFPTPPGDIERRIAAVLEVVNVKAPLDKKLSHFSGGQQARLLLAFALIQEPDILLLDEPTNNLDKAGIEHLTQFLINYEKTCLVISHDAQFLNAFTQGVLYLDSYLHKVDQFTGDYFDVVEQIAAQIERERMQNARMEKQIQDRKDKVNFFANKGGKMRRLASKLRDQIEEAEENQVDVRQEDKTIRPFKIESQDFSKPVVKIKSVHVFKDHKPTIKKVGITMNKRDRLQIIGPNGIGKSTLLRHLADGSESGAVLSEGVKVGYYRQDFSGIDHEKSVFDVLVEKLETYDNQKVYSVAAQFLLHSSLLKNKVATLSEGQKGLLCFAQFVLQKPGLLILDEPTNHINFRHIPVIAEALNQYSGAIIIVSHMPEFIEQLQVDQVLDLGSD